MQDQTENASNIIQFEAKVEEPAKRKKVAILGFTESWKQAPFTDPDYEIWGLNELYMFIEKFPNGRWDRWFEIHKREVYEADKKRTSEHVQRLQQMAVPVYMHQHWDDIPTSVEYPLQTVIANFGDYLTNTISYMIALAILEGFEEIGIYGVDMAHDSEYGNQRPSCEYFIGIARGRGIKVHIPLESDLLKTVYRYGYEEEQEHAFHAKMIARKQELVTKLADIERQVADLVEARAQYRGAIQDCDHVMQRWVIPIRG